MIRLVFPPFYHSLSPMTGEAGGWGGDTTLEQNEVNAFQTVTVQQCRFSKSSPSRDLQHRSCLNLGFKEAETQRLADATQKVQAVIVATCVTINFCLKQNQRSTFVPSCADTFNESL